MKKFTCKFIPKNNEEIKTEEFDIVVEDTCNESKIWKYILLGTFVAFCMGMAVAMLAWCAYINTFGVDPVKFITIMSSILVLSVTVAICGTVIICKVLSLESRSKHCIKEKIVKAISEKSSESIKSEKGFNFKISKF